MIKWKKLSTVPICTYMKDGKKSRHTLHLIWSMGTFCGGPTSLLPVRILAFHEFSRQGDREYSLTGHKCMSKVYILQPLGRSQVFRQKLLVYPANNYTCNCGSYRTYLEMTRVDLSYPLWQVPHLLLVFNWSQEFLYPPNEFILITTN